MTLTFTTVLASLNPSHLTAMTNADSVSAWEPRIRNRCRKVDGLSDDLTTVCGSCDHETTCGNVCQAHTNYLLQSSNANDNFASTLATALDMSPMNLMNAIDTRSMNFWIRKMDTLLEQGTDALNSLYYMENSCGSNGCSDCSNTTPGFCDVVGYLTNQEGARNLAQASQNFQPTGLTAISGFANVGTVAEFIKIANQGIRRTYRKCARYTSECDSNKAILNQVVNAQIFGDGQQSCSCNDYNTGCDGLGFEPQICKDLRGMIAIFENQDAGIRQVPLSHALVGGFITDENPDHLQAFIDRVHFEACSNKMVLNMFKLQKRVGQDVNWDAEDDFSVVMRDFQIYHASSHVMFQFLDCMESAGNV